MGMSAHEAGHDDPAPAIDDSIGSPGIRRAYGRNAAVVDQYVTPVQHLFFRVHGDDGRVFQESLHVTARQWVN
jgi:hypothetical protein